MIWLALLVAALAVLVSNTCVYLVAHTHGRKRGEDDGFARGFKRGAALQKAHNEGRLK